MTLEQVRLVPLPPIPSAGGRVLRALRCTDEGFVGFGEAYFSIVGRGVVKAWKQHQRMTSNLVVPYGRVRFVFYTPDAGSEFLVHEIGEGNYGRLTVPSGIWFGFQGLGEPHSIVLNVADLVHDPDECLTKERDTIPFDWPESEPT